MIKSASSSLSMHEAACSKSHSQAHRDCPTQLAIFPLPIFLLPSGITRLRIFEPRYLTMISTSSDGRGFVIATCDKGTEAQLPKWGARVQVVDFHTDNGVLVIDVQAVHLVSLGDTKRQNDGLLIADVQYLDHWATLEKPAAGGCSLEIQAHQHPSEQMNALVHVLKKIVSQHSLLSNVYQNLYLASPQWVCARFLEILPLSLNEKEKFIEPRALEHIQSFLFTLVLGSEIYN
ncbi:conserved hypothetical protein [Shewanella denitrificans OS217]|uniref:Lon N-terminal domain-containing protein n=2 Tax=Shewanella TaxID=22 RepID=Q12IS5_SHEDO|nr:conserved hypothetical protein [Shewanella denitrificans OS217]